MCEQGRGHTVSDYAVSLPPTDRDIHRQSGKAFHWILDRGTCHQTANLNLGPGTDQATGFGPFFVLPFNTTVVRL